MGFWPKHPAHRPTTRIVRINTTGVEASSVRMDDQDSFPKKRLAKGVWEFTVPIVQTAFNVHIRVPGRKDYDYVIENVNTPIQDLIMQPWTAKPTSTQMVIPGIDGVGGRGKVKRKGIV